VKIEEKGVMRDFVIVGISQSSLSQLSIDMSVTTAAFYVPVAVASAPVSGRIQLRNQSDGRLMEPSWSLE
jgi:hypothetical protein